MTAAVRQSGVDAAQAARRAAGSWLRDLREARGLSQRQLAQALGIEFYSFIAQIEAGRGRIPPERYEAWAKALDIPPRDFVREALRHYEPATWRILFGEEATPADAAADQGRV